MVKSLGKIRVCALLMLSLPLLTWSQTENGVLDTRVSDYLRSGDGFNLGIQPSGLFDPSRMSFTHSYSMNYFSSGGAALAQGLFMETIRYRLSNPVTLTLNLGYLHQPYSTFDSGVGPSQSGEFLGGASLTWRPADNMFLHIELANYPKYYGYGAYPRSFYNPGFSPFGAPVVPEEIMVQPGQSED